MVTWITFYHLASVNNAALNMGVQISIAFKTVYSWGNYLTCVKLYFLKWENGTKNTNLIGRVD